MSVWKDEKLRRVLRQGGVAVMPTDTIYGLVGRAESERTVSRIRKLKKRSRGKPFIILISKISDLSLFGVILTPSQRKEIKKIWPAAVSIILPAEKAPQTFLLNGEKSLAFRMPRSAALRELISKTGPLIAPSANPKSLKPAVSTEEAEEYFGRDVDYYYDGGILRGKPSSIISLKPDGSISWLRGDNANIKFKNFTVKARKRAPPASQTNSS